MNKLTQSIILFVIAFALAFYQAFIFMMVYNWFVPAATGWTPINYWLSFGINLLILLILPITNTKQNEEQSFLEHLIRLLGIVFVYGFILLVAWLVHFGI